MDPRCRTPHALIIISSHADGNVRTTSLGEGVSGYSFFSRCPGSASQTS